MALDIHPTALVDPHAVLEDGVSVGAYSVISDGAFIGANTRILNHVTVSGNVRVGEDNVVYPNCVLGAEPQDISYRGSPTWVVIGDRNILREGVTVHRATEKEYGVTRVGSDNYLMAYCHVAHDVIMGSHVTLANGTALSGHVHVQDHASLSGLVGVHHFTTIGAYAFVGGMSRVVRDVPPYMLVEGHSGEVRCVNIVGLRRNGFSNDEIRCLSEAHRLLFRMKLNTVKAHEVLEGRGLLNKHVLELFGFIERLGKGRHGRSRERLRAA